MATNVAGSVMKIPKIVLYSYKDFEVDVKKENGLQLAYCARRL